MRIYMINANWGHGGPGGIVADLYNIAINMGHECRVAYARETIPRNVNSYRIGSMLDVYSHVFISRLLDNAGFLSSSATKRLIEDIKNYRPDVINIHNPLGYTMNVEILLNFIRMSKIPTVWTLHDCWSFTGHCTTDVCERVHEGCGSCPHTKDFPKSLFFDRSAHNLKRKKQNFSGIENLHFVGPSKWICDLAKKSYLKDNDIRHIPNGIDLDVFHPEPSELRKKYGLENKIVLLGVASVWSARKGASYLLDLMRKVDERFVLVMIGKMDRTECAEKDNIIYIDRTENRKQLAEWYSTADVFVNPTLGDNFPTVNLEALACGTPVVTFNTGGSAEAVGDCGKIVYDYDVVELKDAINSCLEDRIATDQCVQRAQMYDKKARYMDYLSLFEAIADRSSEKDK